MPCTGGVSGRKAINKSPVISFLPLRGREGDPSHSGSSAALAPHKLHIVSLPRSFGKAASFVRRTLPARRYAHSAICRFPMETRIASSDRRTLPARRYAGLSIGDLFAAAEASSGAVPSLAAKRDRLAGERLEAFALDISGREDYSKDSLNSGRPEKDKNKKKDGIKS